MSNLPALADVRKRKSMDGGVQSKLAACRRHIIPEIYCAEYAYAEMLIDEDAY